MLVDVRRKGKSLLAVGRHPANSLLSIEFGDNFADNTLAGSRDTQQKDTDLVVVELVDAVEQTAKHCVNLEKRRADKHVVLERICGSVWVKRLPEKFVALSVEEHVKEGCGPGRRPRLAIDLRPRKNALA